MSRRSEIAVGEIRDFRIFAHRRTVVETPTFLRQAAIEADAGEALPDLRQALAEAKAGLGGSRRPSKSWCAERGRPLA